MGRTRQREQEAKGTAQVVGNETQERHHVFSTLHTTSINKEHFLRIPIHNHVRSQNLLNTAAICVYKVLRQKYKRRLSH
jgi:tRNA(Leu) C34 or U34 (ribose-2'-O)-methylase TrmL